MTTTLSQIAADVRRLAPEHFPTGLAAIECVDGTVSDGAKTNVARLALVGAMVLATRVDGFSTGWKAHRGEKCSQWFPHADHGNDPLLSLHAAFLWAKGGKP